MSKSIPYNKAMSGSRAREEVIRMLRGFGAESIGFMDDFERNEVLLAFTHHGRNIQLRASAQGWAHLYLRENPWSSRRSGGRHDYERKVLAQGMIAVNSILRDWVKGQVTAIECGMLSFETVFMPYMLTNDGRPVIERVQDMLPKANENTVVALEARRQ